MFVASDAIGTASPGSPSCACSPVFSGDGLVSSSVASRLPVPATLSIVQTVTLVRTMRIVSSDSHMRAHDATCLNGAGSFPVHAILTF